MYTLLSIFFLSLLSIIVMIGRKLVMLRNGEIEVMENVSLEAPHIDKIKELSVRGVKKYGRAGLVGVIRAYVKSSNFFKGKYEELKEKIKSMNSKKDHNGNGVEKVEVSKFLKIISGYKDKIQEIKEQIHEEEKNL